MNSYNIYVVNQMSSEQEFFCFLAAPQMSPNTGTVYANSSAYVSVIPNSPALSSFTVPVQYVLMAGANNAAVGLNLLVNTTVTDNANLGDQWLASFADPVLHQAGTLAKYGTAAPAAGLVLQTNPYPQGNEAVDHWYASETFGIETESGFIGVTWAPVAGTTTTIIPNLQFYVATGGFTANALASMTTVSTTSQVVNLTDFDAAFNCTVTRTSGGTWAIAPGMPPAGHANVLTTLVDSHFLLSRAHDVLVAREAGANSDIYLTKASE